MKPESLDRAAELCVSSLGKDKQIDLVDKAELMLLLNNLLSPDTYEENRQVLAEEHHKRKVLRPIRYKSQ